jgi:hypothetical protein
MDKSAGLFNSIRVKHFSTAGLIDDAINKWLDENIHVSVIDIKFSQSRGYTDALIIYTKE